MRDRRKSVAQVPGVLRLLRACRAFEMLTRGERFRADGACGVAGKSESVVQSVVSAVSTAASLLFLRALGPVAASGSEAEESHVDAGLSWLTDAGR